MFKHIDTKKPDDAWGEFWWKIGLAISFIIKLIPILARSWYYTLKATFITVKDLKAGAKFNGETKRTHWTALAFIAMILISAFEIFKWRLHPDTMFGWSLIGLVVTPIVLGLLNAYINIRQQNREYQK